jgi:hypothetical protein
MSVPMMVNTGVIRRAKQMMRTVLEVPEFEVVGMLFGIV